MFRNVRKPSMLVAAAGLAIAAAVPAHAAIVINGGFTAPATGTGYTNTSTVPGWTDTVETGGFAEVGANAVYGLPTIGSGYNAEVNNNTFGVLVQTVSGLIVDQTYNFSYEYGGRPDGGPQGLNVTIGGSSLGPTATGSMGFWTLKTGTFTATDTSELLSFTAVDMGGLPSYGNEVTSVSISPVPEPATWALMLIGFGLIGFAMRKRSNVRTTVTYA